MKDVALLVLRLVTGSLMTGHGAQKLFGAFGGPGLGGAASWLESMGLRPSRPWAYAAGLSEFGGGTLTALGLFYPLGPLGIIASMSMATVKVHWPRPVWVTEGGAELPLTNAAISLALIIGGPGRYSLDRAFGIRLPWFVEALAAAGIAAGLTKALLPKPARRSVAHEQAQSEVQPDRTRQAA